MTTPEMQHLDDYSEIHNKNRSQVIRKFGIARVLASESPAVIARTQPKTDIANVSLTEAEDKRLDEIAGRDGISKSEYLRRALSEALAPLDLAAELKRRGIPKRERCDRCSGDLFLLTISHTGMMVARCSRVACGSEWKTRERERPVQAEDQS